jgi:uncharacterized tellurite resistance protein B-like protein
MTHVHFSDSTTQAALFETMILAAAADGAVEKVEVETIYRLVFERPEFHGIHATDLKQAIEHAAKRLAEAHSLEHILPAIVDRLPDKASRQLAFGLAVAVVVSDGRTPPSSTASCRRRRASSWRCRSAFSCRPRTSASCCAS